MVRSYAWLLIVVVLPGFIHAEDWPQWMGANRDGRWNEIGTIDAFPADGAKILWRKPLAGGYAGPAVANGKVYVFDYVREDGKGNGVNFSWRRRSSARAHSGRRSIPFPLR